MKAAGIVSTVSVTSQARPAFVVRPRASLRPGCRVGASHALTRASQTTVVFEGTIDGVCIVRFEMNQFRGKPRATWAVYFGGRGQKTEERKKEKEREINGGSVTGNEKGEKKKNMGTTVTCHKVSSLGEAARHRLFLFRAWNECEQGSSLKFLCGRMVSEI